MSFTVGSTVGPYRIDEQLGRGGMATVYKAYHARLDRHVAIKVLHPAITQDRSFTARFEREAQVVAKLDHRHIVPVYDFAEHGGQAYLVMKYVAGETLKQRLERESLSLQDKLEVIEAVGSALGYAHRKNILHRDVKPSNVILSNNGGIYLADFGLARMVQAGESTLSHDMLLGTPHYISPEQARGERDLGPKSDIYSFGVMLFELFVGQVPFDADSPYSIVHDHIFTPLPQPRQLKPDLPEVLEAVLLKALAKEPAERYPDVESLLADCREAVAGQIGEDGIARPTAPVSPEGTTVGAVATRTRYAADPAVAAAVPSPVPQLASDAPAAVARTAAAGTGAASVTDTAPSAAETRARRSARLAWVVAAVVTVCLLATVAFGLRVRSNRQATGETPVPGDTLPADLAPEQRAAIERAQQAVAENPDDPGAYLALSEQYSRAGMRDAAQDAFVAGAEVAGFAPEYYVDATQMIMAEQRVPIGALPVLADGLKRHPDNPELMALAEQAMFLAAPAPPAVPVLQDFHATYPDWYVPQVALARSLLLHGDPAAADEQLAPLLHDRPDDILVRFVHAELLFASGQQQQARRHFGEILVDPETPPWLRDVILQRREAGAPGDRPQQQP